MQDKSKISTGPNSRPRNESIAQTAPGQPDDTSSQVNVDETEVERVREKLTKKQPKDKRPEDMPGAAGFRSARADEDTYD
jgi:hypothetical protein